MKTITVTTPTYISVAVYRHFAGQIHITVDGGSEWGLNFGLPTDKAEELAREILARVEDDRKRSKES